MEPITLSKNKSFSARTCTIALPNYCILHNGIYKKGKLKGKNIHFRVNMSNSVRVVGNVKDVLFKVDKLGRICGASEKGFESYYGRQFVAVMEELHYILSEE